MAKHAAPGEIPDIYVPQSTITNERTDSDGLAKLSLSQRKATDVTRLRSSLAGSSPAVNADLDADYVMRAQGEGVSVGGLSSLIGRADRSAAGSRYGRNSTGSLHMSVPSIHTSKLGAGSLHSNGGRHTTSIHSRLAEEYRFQFDQPPRKREFALDGGLNSVLGS